MQIDFSDSQDENASSSILVSLESGANTNVSRELHELKHATPRNSTDEGRQIDLSDLQHENAFSTIRHSLEFDSNDTRLRAPQELKHESPRI
jgi:hypothetical protein